jgi:predicted RNA-binding protein with RPS1 domain
MSSAMPSRHAGDRSFQRNVTWEHVKLALTSGRVTQGENGNLIHEVRHPDNPEHVVKVVTSADRKKVVSVMIKENQGNPALSIQQAKEKANAEKVRQQTSAQRQAEQLAKKRRRNPPKS